MQIPIPRPETLATLLARQARWSPPPIPLRDTAPDPGLFGPQSVTWRVLREPLLILGGGRALLMQAAHPLIAQGAIDHSGYETDPFGRLGRTLTWVTVVTFGTTGEAVAATRGINRLHRRVNGALPRAHATSRIGAGTPYSARDPLLLRWVHASFVDTMLSTHDALVGGLDADERDSFVREWDAVAQLLGIPAGTRWRDHADMCGWVDRQIEAGRVACGAGSRLVAETVLHPPLPSPALRPIMDAVAFATAGLLPPALRRGYGISWTPAHGAAHRAMRTWLRGTRTVMPRRLRVSPVYDRAMARVAGGLARAA